METTVTRTAASPVIRQVQRPSAGLGLWPLLRRFAHATLERINVAYSSDWTEYYRFPPF